MNILHVGAACTAFAVQPDVADRRGMRLRWVFTAFGVIDRCFSMPIPVAALVDRVLADAGGDNAVSLAPGDWLLYDNHRMAHARTAFRGARWVRGVYFEPGR